MTRVAALCVCLAVLASPANAQNPVRDSARVLSLDSIAVRVTRADARLADVPAAVSLLTGLELRAARPGIGLDEALGVIPGVYVSNRHNFSLGPRLSMRGLGVRAAFGVRGVKVVADGIPLTMPDGQTNLNNLDLLSAGAIEILRGPASALWGNAAGGVLLVRTDVPADGTTRFEARAAFSDLGRGGDDATNLRRFALKGAGGAGRLGWLISASRLEQRGFRAHSDAEANLVNTLVRIGTGASSELTLVLNAADVPVANNPGSLPIDSARNRPSIAWPNNVRTGSGESARQIQMGASFNGALGAGRIEAGTWALTRTVDNPLPFAYIEVDRKAAGARVAWNGAPAQSAAVQVTVGADLEHQQDERREFDNASGSPGSERRRDQTDRVTAVAPFAQATLALGDGGALTAGVRYDRVSFDVDDALLSDGRDDSGTRTLSATSAFAGLAWDAAPRWTVWGNIATAFQTPTTTELLNAPPPAGGPCCPGGFNAELDPQTARGIELGVRTRGTRRITFDVAAFLMNVDDAIVPFQVADVPDRSFFRNAGRTRHRGIEAGLGFAAAGAQARAAYTWNRSTFVDDGDDARSDEGNIVPGAPEHRVVVRVRRPFGRLAAEIDLDRVSEYPVDDANEFMNPGSTVVDLRLEADLAIGASAIVPWVALLNATDERWNGSVVVNAVGGRYYEPAPGRHLMLGFTLRTGSSR